MLFRASKQSKISDNRIADNYHEFNFKPNNKALIEHSKYKEEYQDLEKKLTNLGEEKKDRLSKQEIKAWPQTYCEIARGRDANFRLDISSPNCT